MTRETHRNSPLGPDDIIAYLDGEVDAETRQHIERRLAEDPHLVQQMRGHQRAWDLLDELPRPEVRDGFAETTLEMVAVAAASGMEPAGGKAQVRRVWIRGALAASMLAATGAAFWVTSGLLDRPNRQLLQDLPVIENLEALQEVEDIEFLYALENEGLFMAEVSDEP